jgi:hypothetical protein
MKTILLTIALKRTKSLGLKLTKEMKNQCNENYN